MLLLGMFEQNPDEHRVTFAHRSIVGNIFELNISKINLLLRPVMCTMLNGLETMFYGTVLLCRLSISFSVTLTRLV